MDLETYLTTSEEERTAYIESLAPEGLLWLGIALYNTGHYWHAHEAWEAAWLDAPRELRYFYQGLIQVTAAFVHVVRNEYPGSVRLLEAGVAKLAPFPASFQGIALGKLRDEASAARERLLALGEKRLREFDRASIPRIVDEGSEDLEQV